MSKSKKMKEANINMRRTLPAYYLFTQDDACAKNDLSKTCSLDDYKDKKRDEKPDGEKLKKQNNNELKENNNKPNEKENNDAFANDSEDYEEEDNEDQQDELRDFIGDDSFNKSKKRHKATIAKRRQSNQYPSVLTWQNHRRISICTGRTSNANVNLAEAIPCFQSETPKHFHARDTKNNTQASIDPPKLMQNRSASQTRTCAATVPSQEEREEENVKNMKKCQVKAKSTGVPRGLHMVPKVAKKPMNACSATQFKGGEAACAASSLQGKSLASSAGSDKTSCGRKNTIPKIMVTDDEGIIMEQQTISFCDARKENNAKGVTRVKPFSFEARNKDQQMKKEQRLKSLQEAKICKVKFRARPAPNFSKPSNASGNRKNVTSSFPGKCSTKDKNAACSVDQEASLKRKIRPFEGKLKRKEMENEEHVKTKLRPLTLVKARPMPKYKPVIANSLLANSLLANSLQATKQLTKPQSSAFASKLESKRT